MLLQYSALDLFDNIDFDFLDSSKEVEDTVDSENKKECKGLYCNFPIEKSTKYSENFDYHMRYHSICPINNNFKYIGIK